METQSVLFVHSFHDQLNFTPLSYPEALFLLAFFSLPGCFFFLLSFAIRLPLHFIRLNFRHFYPFYNKVVCEQQWCCCCCCCVLFFMASIKLYQKLSVLLINLLQSFVSLFLFPFSALFLFNFSFHCSIFITIPGWNRKKNLLNVWAHFDNSYRRGKTCKRFCAAANYTKNSNGLQTLQFLKWVREKRSRKKIKQQTKSQK